MQPAPCQNRPATLSENAVVITGVIAVEANASILVHQTVPDFSILVDRQLGHIPGVAGADADRPRIRHHIGCRRGVAKDAVKAEGPTAPRCRHVCIDLEGINGTAAIRVYPVKPVGRPTGLQYLFCRISRVRCVRSQRPCARDGHWHGDQAERYQNAGP